MKKLEKHSDLEKHCVETYNMLTENLPDPPAVPLDSDIPRT